MKIRTSYVSNSSSSSFVVFGREVTIREAKSCLNKSETFAIGESRGHSGVCGDYVVSLTPVRMKHIINNPDVFRGFRFIESDFAAYLVGYHVGETLKLPDINDKQVFLFEKDYKSPSFDSDLLEFIEVES